MVRRSVMIRTRSVLISAYSMNPAYLIGGYVKSWLGFFAIGISAPSGQVIRGRTAGSIAFLDLESGS